MPFTEVPTGYEKTILSDLQGAWSLLRDSVVDTAGFEGWDRAIFHIDEAINWETVRTLKRMPPRFKSPVTSIALIAVVIATMIGTAQPAHAVDVAPYSVTSYCNWQDPRDWYVLNGCDFVIKFRIPKSAQKSPNILALNENAQATLNRSYLTAPRLVGSYYEYEIHLGRTARKAGGYGQSQAEAQRFANGLRITY